MAFRAEGVLHLSGFNRVFRQPVAVWRVAFHQINHDGVTVGQHQLTINQHWNLRQRAQFFEFVGLAQRRWRIDVFKRQAEHVEQ